MIKFISAHLRFPTSRGSYSYSWLKKDLSAGFTVAMLALPQAMAYALVADLPPMVGVAAAIFATLFFGVFGSSRHLVSGPTNSVAILLQGAITEILYTHYRGIEGPDKLLVSLQIMSQLTILAGLLQALFGLLRLGALAQFVSRPVVVAYVTGTALAVIIEQFFAISGVPRPEGALPAYEKIWYFLTHVDLISWPTLGMGGLTASLILLLKKIHKSFPASLVALAVVALVIYFGRFLIPDFIAPIKIVRDIGGIDAQILRTNLPPFNLQIIGRLIPAAFAVAIMGVLETTSLAKTLSVKSGQKISTNQDMFGLGIGNLASGIFGGMPSSGSLSRSIINYDMGAKTKLAALFSAMILLLMILVFSTPVSYVPLASLSALLIIAVLKIFDARQFSTCVRSTRSDAIVLFVTLISCMLFGLDVAFYLGVGISISLYLRLLAKPNLTEYVPDEDHGFRVVEPGEYVKNRKIRIIHVEGELFFGASDLFLDHLRQIAGEKESRAIILRLKNAHHVDATACITLSRLLGYMRKRGRYLLASGLTPRVFKVFSRAGLLDEWGKEFLFEDSVSQYGSTRKAYEAAQNLIQGREQDPT